MKILAREELVVNNRWSQVGVPFRALVKTRRPDCLGRHAVFECECGVRKIVLISKVRSGDTQSCGCLSSEGVTARNTKHGLSRSGAYYSWQAMVARCTKENAGSWSRYGAVGITVCDRWLVFENFYEDMGDRPVGGSIERKNSKEGYGPDNCIWATRVEQSRNKSNNVFVSANGRSMTVIEWANETGINQYTLYRRVNAGWDDDSVINKPVRVWKRKNGV